jgi:D-glycero-beta-D-manno-heptose-7-phosphate kinase
MNRLTAQRLEELLDRARGARVLVVGDLMLDVYMRGAASRLSPEAPVPVVSVEEEWRALGGAANVAANVAALGAACIVVGCLGTDGAGAELATELAASGIGSEGIAITKDRPTTVKTRVMARHHQIVRYDREIESDVSPAIAAMLVEAIEKYTPGVQAVVLEDYNKGVLIPTVIEAALDAARRQGCYVVVDPKSRHFFDYRGAGVFKPNMAELVAALRAPVLPDDAEWMERTRKHLECDNLLVTLGEGGIALMTDAGEHVRVPTVARSVFDVSGAGDTVTAALAVALAAGANVVEAAIVANHAAGVEVAKAGVATVSPDELRIVVGQEQ